jgi:hypothetical protein
MSDDDGFDLTKSFDKSHAYIQWKGTDVCMDFHCECKAHCHFDGYFAYAVKCPHCGAVWQMPSNLFPRKMAREDDDYWFDNAKLLETDEDRET